MLDGALARYMNIQSERGAFIDMVCDYTSFFVVFLTFGYYGFVDLMMGTVFIIAYMALQAMISMAVMKGVKVFPVIRPKLLVYLAFFVYLVSGYDFVNDVVIFMTFYMIVTDFFVFRKIICSI